MDRELAGRPGLVRSLNGRGDPRPPGSAFAGFEQGHIARGTLFADTLTIMSEGNDQAELSQGLL